MHLPTPLSGQRHRSCEIQAFSTDQCAVFSQAVSGYHIQWTVVALLPKSIECNAGGQQCWLGNLGLIQAIFGAVLGKFPEIVSENLGSDGKGMGDNPFVGTSASMPIVWDPCPGNTIASMGVLCLLVGNDYLFVSGLNDLLPR